MADLREAAVGYARKGIPVFRLRPGEKIPFPRTRGFLDATADVAVVDRMWSETPEANIGALCGVKFAVLDIDSEEGMEWAQKIMGLRDFPDPIGIAQTPKATLSNGAGWHVYLPPLPGLMHRSTTFVPGVDGLGAEGYVILPPSVVDARADRPGKTAVHGHYKWVRELRVD
jgi:hypothetical protein